MNNKNIQETQHYVVSWSGAGRPTAGLSSPRSLLSALTFLSHIVPSTFGLLRRENKNNYIYFTALEMELSSAPLSLEFQRYHTMTETILCSETCIFRV